MSAPTPTPAPAAAAPQKAPIGVSAGKPRPVEQSETSDGPEKVRRPRKPKVDFWTEGQEKLTLETVKGFERGKHNPLTEDAFAKPGDFLRWKADGLEKRAKELRQSADDVDQFGSVQQRKSAEKLRKQVASLAETKAKLREALGDEAFAKFMSEMEAESGS